MQSYRKSAKEIAPGLWTEILVGAGIDRGLLTKKEGPCPICGGNTRFSYYDKSIRGKDSNQNQHGLNYCHHCGGRNGLSLLMEYLGLSAADAYKWIENWYYGQEVDSRPTPIYVPVVEAQMTAAKIAAIKQKHCNCWQRARPVTKGDPVWKYLCNRIPGFHEGMISPVIRYHPGLDYMVYDQESKQAKSLGKFPAMIAYITGPNGDCQDIHRTYLTPDGQKADVPSPKKTLASYGVFGGAIQLSRPCGNVLAVSEGIETAYAVELFKGLPTWALLNTSNMMKFVIPSGITVLHIFEDNDAPNRQGVKVGTKAATVLQERAKEAGVKVLRHTVSSTGMDFLDLLVKLDKQELRI